MNLSLENVVIMVCFLFISLIDKCHLHNYKADVVFIAPKNNHDIYKLNEESLFRLNKVAKKGWLIEANKPHTFNIFLKLTANKNAKFQSYSHYEDIYYVYFTTNNSACDLTSSYIHTPVFVQTNFTSNGTNITAIYRTEIEIYLRHSSKSSYYICIENQNKNGEMEFLHQGTKYFLSLVTYKTYLDMWMEVVIYGLLILLNSFFNGLNLGLMSLSVEELELLIKTSDSMKERKYAQNILPLRKKGNYLLCSILLSIALTSSVSTLLLDGMTDGLVAGLLSTVILCIIGEIMPQSICSKYSLPIGSYTRYLTMFFLFLTTPISYPFGKIIDFILGKEVPTEYNRDRIQEMIRKSEVLQEKELKFINGTLDFRNKKVSDIMVKLEDVFMLEEKVKLDFTTMLYIYNNGYSRIPVYHQSREQIVGFFHIRHLSLVDPNDEMPIEKLLSLFKNKVAHCYKNERLDNMFEIFRRGETHIAFVCEIVQNEETDPYEKCIGIVTLHDVIEALIQYDIKDEFDSDEKPTHGANYLKQIVANCIERKLSSDNFDKIKETNVARKISPKTRLSIMQLLCAITPFKDGFIDRSVLEQLLMDDRNFIRLIIPHNLNSIEEFHYVYKYDKPSNYFVMLIEGTMVLEVGQDKTEFLIQPFHHFGVQALLQGCKNVDQIIENKSLQHQYYPEFTLKVDYKTVSKMSNSDKEYTVVLYLKIDRTLWLNAIKTTQLKRTKSL